MVKTAHLRYAIAILFFTLFCAGSANAEWYYRDKLTADDFVANDVFGCSVAVDGSYCVIGVEGDDDNGSGSGSAYIFKKSDSYNDAQWYKQCKLIAEDGDNSDSFGCSVAINGDYAIIGAEDDEENGTYSGSAYVFKKSATPGDPNWYQQCKLTAEDADSSDNFGCSVSINGDYAIIGAQNDEENGPDSGSAYVFKKSDTPGDSNWYQQYKILAEDGGGNENFGCSVSLDGDYTVIGAGNDDENGPGAGAAYIFKKSTAPDDPCWYQQCKLLDDQGDDEDYLGYAVSLSGDYAILGATGDDDNDFESGAALIFMKSSTPGDNNWYKQCKITAEDGASTDNFGCSVSISGDVAIVGADYYANDIKGAVYAFRRSGVSWNQEDKMTAPDGSTADSFGHAVSVNADYAIVGAYYDDNDSLLNTGSAYIFRGFSEVHGIKWHDSNGDCEIDADEQVLPGWRIYVDENENGSFDPCEVNDITDADGAYSLLVPAGTYVVAEDNGGCWQQSCPGGDGTYTVILKNGEIADGFNFGNAREAELYPSAFLDDQGEKLLAPDGNSNDSFGCSVSISGEYAIIGAQGDDDTANNCGSARIFAPNDVDCTWDQQQILLAINGAADDHFGSAVDISGDYAIIGAYENDDNGTTAGAAYIFNRDGATWSQQKKLLASDGAAGDRFGYSVAISGDYAIAGAIYDDDLRDNSGAAYIFTRDDTDWIQQAKLTALDGAESSQFGISVSISGDYAIVGSMYADNKGAAYIFKRDGTNWSQQAKLTALDGAASDLFGTSVAICGDYALVGASNKNSATGAAYVFIRSVTTWTQQAKLTAENGASGDLFGNSVSIKDDYAVVGAYGDGDNGSYSGAAYVFRRDDTSWSQVYKVPSSGAAFDNFGNSVSISSNNIIVGVKGDDTKGDSAGAAYLFEKDTCPSADLTGDCKVDIDDFSTIANQWLLGVE